LAGVDESLKTSWQVRTIGVLALLASTACVAQNITGAGASFPNPIYSRWFLEYGRMHPGVRINYQPVGSGAGIRQVSERIVDFGATDGPMTDRQLALSKVKLLHIPTVVGAVVPVYNAPGVGRVLNFAPDVLADIYLGRIMRWNDARLRRDNPGVELPDQAIAVVYRADGSGTTYVFTDFLCKVSEGFRQQVGRDTSVAWPVGIGQKGNEGVAGLVRGMPYSIGYVELVYGMQNGMTFGAVRNAAGVWVKASNESVTAAATAALASMPEDYRVSITNAAGLGSYPISSFTWLLMPEHPSDARKGRVMADFLRWMLDRGQQEAASEMYAPLPKAMVERVRVSVERLR
jgi:phosphate transport system substrate-binding protein